MRWLAGQIFSPDFFSRSRDSILEATRILAITHHNVITAFLQRVFVGKIANAEPIPCELTASGLALWGKHNGPVHATARTAVDKKHLLKAADEDAGCQVNQLHTSGKVRLSVVESPEQKHAANFFVVEPTPKALLQIALAKSKRLKKALRDVNAIVITRVQDGRCSNEVAVTSFERISWLEDGDAIYIEAAQPHSILLSHQSALSSRLQPLTPSIRGPIDQAELVTMFISSSPRPQDKSKAGAQMIHQAVLSARRTLCLCKAKTVLVFDGRHPDLPQSAWEDYQNKIRLVQEDPLLAECIVVQHTNWLHQAHGLRLAMEEHMPISSPIVFSMQDDTVVFGQVDTPLILDYLMHDEHVEYVKLFWRSKISLEAYESQPGQPHPSTPLLHSTWFWSDRPHFALRSHYEERVWPCITKHMRVTMEQACEEASFRDRNWGLWIYGPAGDMRREAHSKLIKTSGEGGGSAYFVRDGAVGVEEDGTSF